MIVGLQRQQAIGEGNLHNVSPGVGCHLGDVQGDLLTRVDYLFQPSPLHGITGIVLGCLIDENFIPLDFAIAFRQPAVHFGASLECFSFPHDFASWG